MNQFHRIQEGDDRFRGGEVLVTATIHVHKTPAVLTRGHVARVDFQRVEELIVEAHHRRSRLAKSGADILDDEVLGRVHARSVEHPAHGVIGRSFQPKGDAAIAVARDGVNIGRHQSFRRVLHIKGRSKREVTRHHVRAPVVEIGGESLRRAKVPPCGQFVIASATHPEPHVGREGVEGLGQGLGDRIDRERDGAIRKGLVGAFGEVTMENPNLLAPVRAGAKELGASLAFTSAKAVGLADVHVLEAHLEVLFEILIKQFLHVGIGNAELNLRLAAGDLALAAEQRETLRMLGEVGFSGGDRAMPGVSAEGGVDGGKAILRQMIKAHYRRPGDVVIKNRRLFHIEIRRHRNPRHGKILNGGRGEQIHFRHTGQRGEAPLLREQETRAHILLKKIRHRLCRADSVKA